jgi:hypothetical protein
MTKKCSERWQARKDGRIAALTMLWKAYLAGDDSDEAKACHDEGYGEFHDYGLSFDYVAPGTFGDQQEGYWRYQLSWGGPSDEFRFYSSGPEWTPYRIEYWLLDWFDGHGEALKGDDLALMLEIWEFYRENDIARNEYDKAKEDR